MSKELVTKKSIAKDIVLITLNDPDSRNAMSEEMAKQFADTISLLSLNSELRAIFLIGSGPTFSSGGHLDMLMEKTKHSALVNRHSMEIFYKSFLSLTELDVPVVAIINGHAMGAGLCLTLACDFRVAVSSAKLGFNFVRIGLHPGMGATYFLPRLVGPSRAAELLYTGRVIGAEEAFSIGLINRVITENGIDEYVNETCQYFINAGPLATRELKRSLKLSPWLSLDQSLAQEAKAQAINFQSREFVEGLKAIKEKRPPKF